MTVKIVVEVTNDCEGLLTGMPRGYEYELTDEEYNQDGSGVVTFVIHDLDEMTYAHELALDTHDGVIKYTEYLDKDWGIEHSDGSITLVD